MKRQESVPNDTSYKQHGLDGFSLTKIGMPKVDETEMSARASEDDDFSARVMPLIQKESMDKSADSEFKVTVKALAKKVVAIRNFRPKTTQAVKKKIGASR